MKRPILLSIFTFLPTIAFAQNLPSQVSDFMGKIYVEIINPLITLAFAISILYLSWSVYKYTLNKDKIDKDKLKSSLIYGVVGVAIMSLVFGIMKFIATTITGDPTIIIENV